VRKKKPVPSKLPRIARRVALALLAIELGYVLVANLVIASGFIQDEASKPAENVQLAWDRAYSPWPFRVYVAGLRLRVQDGVQQFHLTVAHARVDVVLWALTHKEFRASAVEADGVSYLMRLKVDPEGNDARRLAAFPPLWGPPRSAFRTTSPPPTPEKLASLWSVALDRVDAAIDELWFLEYRYRGPAHVRGGFAFSPLHRLWIAPTQLALEGGLLSVGGRVLSPTFLGTLEVAIAATDLPSARGLQIFRGLSGSLRFDTSLRDLGVADLYLEGLRVTGSGRLKADLTLAAGRIQPESAIEAWLPATHLHLRGYRYTGASHWRLASMGATPTVTADASGVIALPWLTEGPVSAILSDLTLAAHLAGNDLTSGLHLAGAHAKLGEARVADTQGVSQKIGSVVPIVTPAVFGQGPLVASLVGDLTPQAAIVRLEKLTLGHADLHGAATTAAGGWSGAAMGHFGPLPLGLRLRSSQLDTVPFPADDWLSAELTDDGIPQDESHR
jgi:hypothetical protein